MGSKSVFPGDKNMDYVYYVFIKFLSLIVVNKFLTNFLFVLECCIWPTRIDPVARLAEYTVLRNF